MKLIDKIFCFFGYVPKKMFRSINMAKQFQKHNVSVLEIQTLITLLDRVTASFKKEEQVVKAMTYIKEQFEEVHHELPEAIAAYKKALEIHKKNEESFYLYCSMKEKLESLIN